jgi:hypothetical protein
VQEQPDMGANLYSRLASRHPGSVVAGSPGAKPCQFRVTEWQRNLLSPPIAAEMPTAPAPPGNPPTP